MTVQLSILRTIRSPLCQTTRDLLSLVACVAVILAATAQFLGTAESRAAELAQREPIVAQRPAPPAYQLAYKFQKNQEVHMLLVVESEIRPQKGPVVQTNVNRTSTERHYRVASADADGSALLDLYIDRVRLGSTLNNDPPINYDTATKTSAPHGYEKVEASIGRQSTMMRVNAQGKLMSLAGPQQNQADSFLDILPEKPVRVGEEWYDDVKVPIQVTKSVSQKITLRRRYRLESVEGDIAHIRLTTSEVTPVHEPELRAQLLQRTPVGTILFDTGKGTIAKHDLRCERVETGALGEGSVIAATTSTKLSLK